MSGDVLAGCNFGPSVPFGTEEKVLLRKVLLRKVLRESSTGKFYGKVLRESSMGKFYGKVLRESSTGKFYGKVPRGKERKFLWGVCFIFYQRNLKIPRHRCVIHLKLCNIGIRQICDEQLVRDCGVKRR